VRALREEIVPIGHDRRPARVQVHGSGPPLVYLHSAGGMAWDPFLEELSATHTVYAPLLTGGEPNIVDGALDLWDLVLTLEECLQSLRLEGSDLLGSGFGGMLACELQATFPGTFGGLVALNPLGVWREDAPEADWRTARAEQLGDLLFADPSTITTASLYADGSRDAPVSEAYAAMARPVRHVARFVPPDPVRGLQRRLHRIIAPTLVVWGEQDALVPPVHATEFRRRIDHARVEILPGCGHVPQVERPEETLELVRGTLR